MLTCNSNPDVEPDRRDPAIGSRPGSSNHSSDRHANTRFSDVMLWRRAPTEAEIAEQAGQEISLAATTAGGWPAFPSDL